MNERVKFVIVFSDCPAIECYSVDDIIIALNIKLHPDGYVYCLGKKCYPQYLIGDGTGNTFTPHEAVVNFISIHIGKQIAPGIIIYRIKN